MSMETGTIETPTFPSTKHEKLLKEKLQKQGWNALSADEKLWWHSYVYAWRKAFLRLDHGSPPPTDPRGEWFSARLVALADQAYARGMLRPRKEHITPAMQAYQRGDYETAQRWDDQDRERRKAEGTPEYVGICMRQIRENVARFERGRIR